jgi:hypothetical protein
VKRSLLIPLLVLAGCAAAPAPAATPEPAPAPSTARPATEPLAPPELAFVDRLAQISPTLGEQPERTVGRGENVCADLQKELPDDELAANAGQLFELSPTEGGRIVAAARETLCA